MEKRNDCAYIYFVYLLWPGGSVSFQLMNIPEAEVLFAHLNDAALQGERPSLHLKK